MILMSERYSFMISSTRVFLLSNAYVNVLWPVLTLACLILVRLWDLTGNRIDKISPLPYNRINTIPFSGTTNAQMLGEHHFYW